MPNTATGGRGARSGKNTGARRGTQGVNRSRSKGSVREREVGAKSFRSEGQKKKRSSSMMRQSTWDRLSGREKMQYGTMSYKKYKADMEAMKAKSNKPQRGGGGG
tara:strand:- start:296 stop:610 length:315 start_codon:yes stop_codon:yes gene_type:complete